MHTETVDNPDDRPKRDPNDPRATTIDDEGKKVIPSVSVDSLTLYRHISKLSPGEVAKYEELNSLIGRDVRKGAYGNLDTARNMALKNDGKVFLCIKKVGIKCAEPSEVIDDGECSIRSVRRKMGKSRRRLASVEAGALPEGERVRYSKFAALSGAIHLATSRKAQGRIEQQVVEAGGNRPDMARLKEIFD